MIALESLELKGFSLWDAVVFQNHALSCPHPKVLRPLPFNRAVVGDF